MKKTMWASIALCILMVIGIIIINKNVNQKPYGMAPVQVQASSEIPRNGGDKEREDKDIEYYKTVLHNSINVEDDICAAYKQYQEIKALKDWMEEKGIDPLDHFQVNKNYVYHVVTDKADHLRKLIVRELRKSETQQKFRNQVTCFEWQTPFSMVETLRWIEKENPDLERYRTDHTSGLRERALLKTVRQEAPELRRHWLADKKQWNDAAGGLYGWLVGEGVAPSVLGLTPKEAGELLESHSVK